MSQMETEARPHATRTRTLLLLVVAALVVGFFAGTRYPQANVEVATCDTTDQVIQCYPEGWNGLRLVVHRDGVWQDASHTWRSGLPECLPDGVKKTDPVELAVVEGGDDGMAWKEVVWVGCP